jgi:hypothetical protein
LDEIIDSLTNTANEHGIDSIASLALWLPELLERKEVLEERVRDALDVLVCAPIGDPSEILETTYQILVGEITIDEL